jgi:ATP synthase protein I
MPERPDNNDPLQSSLSAWRRRSAEAKAHGERSFFRNLTVIGTLGWMIVLPTLAGMALGRWLDNRFAGGGIFWTGALLVVGVGIGCRMAWKRMHQE